MSGTTFVTIWEGGVQVLADDEMSRATRVVGWRPVVCWSRVALLQWLGRAGAESGSSPRAVRPFRAWSEPLFLAHILGGIRWAAGGGQGVFLGCGCIRWGTEVR